MGFIGLRWPSMAFSPLRSRRDLAAISQVLVLTLTMAYFEINQPILLLTMALALVLILSFEVRLPPPSRALARPLSPSRTFSNPSAVH